MEPQTNRITIKEAKDRGMELDRSVYPYLAYKGSRFHPEEWCDCYTDLEAELIRRLEEIAKLIPEVLGCGK